MGSAGVTLLFGDIPKAFPRHFLFAPSWANTELAMSLFDAERIKIDISVYPGMRFSLEFESKNRDELKLFLSLCIPELKNRFTAVLKGMDLGNIEPGDTADQAARDDADSSSTEKTMEPPSDPLDLGSFAAKVTGWWDGAYTWSDSRILVSILNLKVAPSGIVTATLSRCMTPGKFEPTASLADMYGLDGRVDPRTGSFLELWRRINDNTELVAPAIDFVLKPGPAGTTLVGSIESNALSGQMPITLSKRPDRGADPCNEAIAPSSVAVSGELLKRIDSDLDDLYAKVAEFFAINTGGDIELCREKDKEEALRVSLKFGSIDSYAKSELRSMLSLPELLAAASTGGISRVLRTFGRRDVGQLVEMISASGTLLDREIDPQVLQLKTLSNLIWRQYNAEMNVLCPSAGVMDTLFLTR